MKKLIDFINDNVFPFGLGVALTITLSAMFLDLDLSKRPPTKIQEDLNNDGLADVFFLDKKGYYDEAFIQLPDSTYDRCKIIEREGYVNYVSMKDSTTYSQSGLTTKGLKVLRGGEIER